MTRNKPATLLYKARCRKCRLLSRVLVWASLGGVRRTPIDGDNAQLLYARYPDARGKLALIDGDFVALDDDVPAAVMRRVLRAWWCAVGGRGRVSGSGGARP